jgi:hypothetical protein
MMVYITSLTLTTVAHVAIIYCIVPFFAAGLAFLVMGERPTAVSIAASLVALIGVAVMVGLSGGEGSLAGDLLALVMTLGMAVMMVISRRHRDIPILAAACLSAILSAAAAPRGRDRVDRSAGRAPGTGLGLAGVQRNTRAQHHPRRHPGDRRRAHQHLPGHEVAGTPKRGVIRLGTGAGRRLCCRPLSIQGDDPCPARSRPASPN